MRACVVNSTDINGGAARASYRIHQALRVLGLDSRMWVNQASAGDWTVGSPQNKFDKAMAIIRPELIRPLNKLLITNNPVIHSPAALPSRWVHRINESDADIVHLHWVQGEMLSIADIGRINKPIVWTLHDMWAFCGAEHYTEDERWRTGYMRSNRPAYESGFDLNRWSWNRKRKHWKKPIQIVTPSNWLAKCVRESQLMREWPVSVIPNPIDTECWKPIQKKIARDILGLPPEVPLLLFGAMGGGRDPRKGFDLFKHALCHLHDHPQVQEMQLVIFGQSAPQCPPDFGFPIHYMGHLHDDLSMRALYSSADLLVVPSRQDNLPNTGIEAQACGTPVAAFQVGGLIDIVEHEETGYLAKAFDVEDLARGILWVLEDENRRSVLSKNARSKAEMIYTSAAVAKQYINIYKKVLSITPSSRN